MSHITSESQSQAINLRKFVLYSKRIATFYMQLQSYKRQLATFLNTTDYTLPFAAIDIDKRGSISEKNLQNFLIQYKYYVKPIDINRYYQKYVHGKYALSYEDIVECLVPHSDYILMSTTAQKITERALYKQHSVYLCKRTQNQIVKNIVALIVNTEIQYLKAAFIMMDDITNGSLRMGALLWRNLDREHDNCLSFPRMAAICHENGVQFSESQWKAFVNWHFRSHKKNLTRADFMIIFDSLITNKRNGSDCNLEQFNQRQALKKVAESQRLKKSKVQEMVSKRIENVSGVSKRSSSSENLSRTIKNRQIIDPEQWRGNKRLLYSKLGYKCPENLIKMSEI